MSNIGPFADIRKTIIFSVNQIQFKYFSFRFSTLVTAVQAAGLVDTIKQADSLTVFAPTNDAFAKVPKDALNSLLADKDALSAVILRHALPGG